VPPEDKQDKINRIVTSGNIALHERKNITHEDRKQWRPSNYGHSRVSNLKEKAQDIKTSNSNLCKSEYMHSGRR